ncbi:unnamed protein product [Rotaria sp. Silwood2]|nr:unnamed protein product [Rotaria sp. Silwood2]
MSQQRIFRHHSNLTLTIKNTEGRRTTIASSLSAPSNNEIAFSRNQSIPLSTQVNRESIIFIWLHLQSQSTPKFISSLRAINDNVRTYTDASTCLEALQDSKDKIFLISSSANEKLIATVDNMHSIEAIFVFDRDANSVNGQYHKFLGVFTQQEELLQMLKKTLDRFQQIQLETFVFEEDKIFLWLQLWKEEVTITIMSYTNYF